MNRAVRRIATHTVLTGLLFAAVGFVLAQVAGLWLTDSPPAEARGTMVEVTTADAAFVSALRANVPLYMALWGGGFVLIAETVLHLRRWRKPAAQPVPQQDAAEKLLEELLAQAEAAAATRTDVDVQTPAPRVCELQLGDAEPAEHQDATR